jgi:hypothetical protein
MTMFEGPVGGATILHIDANRLNAAVSMDVSTRVIATPFHVTPLMVVSSLVEATHTIPHLLEPAVVLPVMVRVVAAVALPEVLASPS